MTELELKVGQRYNLLSELAFNYNFLKFIDFESDILRERFGEKGALIEIGDNRYVISSDGRRSMVVLARYKPKSGKRAEIFIG